jgi:hypothetical protein
MTPCEMIVHIPLFNYDKAMENHDNPNHFPSKYFCRKLFSLTVFQLKASQVLIKTVWPLVVALLYGLGCE